MNALNHIQTNHALPPCIIDGILSSVLAEVRAEEKLELINAANAMMKEVNEDLDKAKAAAKKVLPAGAGQQDETCSEE